MNLSINNNQPARHLQWRAFIPPSTAMYILWKKVNGVLDAPKHFDDWRPAYKKIQQIIWGYESAIDLDIELTIINPYGKKIKSIALISAKLGETNGTMIFDLLANQKIRNRRHTIAEMEESQFDDLPF
jgi:hypothetical protein